MGKQYKSVIEMLCDMLRDSNNQVEILESKIAEIAPSTKCNHDMHWREQYLCAKCGYVSISQPSDRSNSISNSPINTK